MMLFLVKAAIVLSILLGFYKLFLQKESFFCTNRAYLLLGLVLTFLLPMVTLPELVDHQGIVDKMVSVTETTSPNETAVVEKPTLSVEIPKDKIKESPKAEAVSFYAKNKRGITYWIGLLYLFCATILLLNFLTQLFGILMKIKKSKDRIKDGRCIILLQSDETEPCSFFNYIFISPGNYDTNTYEQILEHEKVHLKQYHSVDLLLSELAIIILWFNPLVWWYRKEVEKNIEYQTDAVLLKSKKVVSEDYQINLLNIASHKKSNALVSNYNQSLIKKRIVMMNKQKSNSSSYWKYAFLAPTLFATLLLLNQPNVLHAQEPIEEVYNDVNGVNDYENEFDDDLKPLLLAIREGDYLAVEKMLENGEDVNLFQHGEGTPLTMAIRAEKYEIAKLLLEKGADANLGSQADGYPLWMAARNGNIELVRLLIKNGSDVNTKFRGDGSALIQAAKSGNLEMVEVLVELRADVDMPVRGDGNPLIMASKAGSIDVVKFLVKKGANINEEVPGDETPLINASEQGYLPIVKFLVDKGADVNKKCVEKINGKTRVRTALSLARKKGHDDVVEFLLKNGAEQ